MPINRWHVFAYLGAILCGYILFLLFTLPAYWADWLVSRASNNLARVQQTDGTLWSGTGDLVIQNTGQNRFQARILWELQTLSLLSGKLQVRLRSRDSNSPFNATLRVGYHHISISDVDAVIPTGVLSVLYPAVDLIAPSGRLQITTQQATITPAGLEGVVQLTWLDAGARMSGLNDIGDYRLEVNGRGATAQLRIDTLRGEVGVTAQGEWQTQGEGLIQLAGNITPGNREQTLQALLKMLNVQNNNGQYAWTFNNRFSLARFFGAKQ